MRCSENEQIDEGASRIQSANDLGQQRRDRQHLDLLRAAAELSRKAGTASVTTSLSSAGSPIAFSAPGMNRPCVTIASTRHAPA